MLLTIVARNHFMQFNHSVVEAIATATAATATSDPILLLLLLIPTVRSERSTRVARDSHFRSRNLPPPQLVALRVPADVKTGSKPQLSVLNSDSTIACTAGGMQGYAKLINNGTIFRG